jgi:iron complex transport system substrate-binding protein
MRFLSRLNEGEETVKHKTRFSLLALLLVLSLTAAGCGPKQAGNDQVEKGAGYLTIKDDAGRTVVLNQKPERIIPLSTSYVDLLYAVGGKAVGKPTSKTKLSQEAQQLPEIGQTTNVDLERLIALQPDLVIGFQGRHEKLVPLLESSRIPVIILNMKTYEDVHAKIKLFGEIFGTTHRAQIVSREMGQKIEAVAAQLPSQSKKIVIIRATAKSVTVELENSVAGDVARILKISNIATGSKPMEKDPDATPYSMEKLVEGDPDMVLVTTMGDVADAEKRLKTDVESNPAWSSLRAVRDRQVYFLPSDLFQLNPGIHYDEAVVYMAKVIYPEVYGNVR